MVELLQMKITSDLTVDIQFYQHISPISTMLQHKTFCSTVRNTLIFNQSLASLNIVSIAPNRIMDASTMPNSQTQIHPVFHFSITRQKNHIRYHLQTCATRLFIWKMIIPRPDIFPVTICEHPNLF